MTDFMKQKHTAVLKGTCGISYAYIFFIPYIMITVKSCKIYFIGYRSSSSNLLLDRRQYHREVEETWSSPRTRGPNLPKIQVTLNLNIRYWLFSLKLWGVIRHEINLNDGNAGVVTDKGGFVYFNELAVQVQCSLFTEKHMSGTNHLLNTNLSESW